MTVYEIVDTPFTREYDADADYDPYIEVNYEWQDQRFVYGRSPLEQRMMLVPALVGLVLILLGLFVFPRVVAGIGSGSTVDTVAAEEGKVETAVSPASPAGATGAISAVFSPEIQHWAPQIVAWSEQFDLDPDITATIMQIESCGDPNAVSGAGAQGLFQVMPFHFTAGEDMQNPDTNAFRGLKFYATMLQHTGGDVFLSFAGYNGGYAASDNPYSTWPNETQRYFYWAKGIYDDAKAGNGSSERLAEWMAAGGSGLCRQAAARLGL
ncbi:MAG: transglycosylase SLT domain-containing protein [Ardenticatenaceae bacterium]|nr:transglycosylase SLT domain-containing protein [Ardenticatenaceae bacterium]